jgi:hypothetical protein
MAADMVLQWNALMDGVIRADTTQIGPTYGARNYAILHAAIYDAVNSIDRQFAPLFVDHVAPANASKEAAVAAAAHTALDTIYPLQSATFDAFYAQSLASIPDGPAEDAGVAVGELVAQQILANRSTDHAGDIVSYIPKTDPGKWRPAEPILTTPAWGPGWGHVTPFVINSADDFLPPPPPSMTSAEYTVAFNEVKELGRIDSTTRTPEQTQIGIFWGYDRGGLGPPSIFFNQITRQISVDHHLTLSQNARLFALANVAQADAGIVSWDAKFTYDLWRPIAAIREADTDGNPDTIADPTWSPLGAPAGGPGLDFTPPFPAYTSGHATFGAAFFTSLANFFGTDKFEFSASSDELPGVTRTFHRFSDAAAENARSRIYLGVHWNFDDALGQSSGRDVANYIFQNAFQPLDPGTAIVATGADAGFAPRVRVFDATNHVLLREFDAFHPAFRGGVRVATGDIDRDGVDDIVAAAGVGGGPHVRVFSGATGTVLHDFFAYDPTFLGGVNVASGDIDGDGFADIITAADAGGGPHVKVFSGATGAELRSFFAYSPLFNGGVRVAAGDIDGDQVVDIITAAGAGGGPHVCVYSGADNSLIRSFYAYNPGFTGGVYVAAGDFDSDSFGDFVTGAGASGGPHVRVLSGRTGAELLGLFAYSPSFAGGVRVGIEDFDHDGRPDVLATPGPGGQTQLRTFDGQTGQLMNQFVTYGGFAGGAFVAGLGNRGATLESAQGEAEVYQQAPEYTSDELTPLLSAAIERWGAAGLNAESLARLQHVSLVVSDLAGATIGSSYQDVVVVDHNAAGHGWFVDGTPGDDAEFTQVDGNLEGHADSMAGAQFDLLSVIMHELGHVLGLNHAPAGAGDLMQGNLSSGVRRLPSAADVDAVFAAM